MKAITYRLLVTLSFILVIGTIGILVQRYGRLTWLVENELRMRDLVREHPWQSWLIGLTTYTAFSLVPGTSGKSVVFGWIFGFWSGVLLVDCGLTLAAIVAFSVARFVIRDAIHAKFGGLVEKVDRGLEKDGAFYLLIVRLAHVPFTIVNYASGATSVKLATFSWTTAVGILPGTMIFVFVGSRIPTLKELETQGAWELLDPLLFVFLAATMVFPILIRFLIRKVRQRVGHVPGIDISALKEPDRHVE